METAIPAPAALNRPRVVGSIATVDELESLDPAAAARACDIVEIRLDGLAASLPDPDPAAWRRLSPLPLLFTARRPEEGGVGSMDAGQRARWLEAALPDASWIDIEAASLSELAETIDQLRRRGIGLIVSHHDFQTLPPTKTLEHVVDAARSAGATVAKIAAHIDAPADLARLADFTLADHGLPLATMGMGRFAAVSRLLCAQCGSVLNYGFLSTTPTAPGQWPAARLKKLIAEITAE